MEFMDFVIENYIWFLVGGVVILMTIVGYFAEKTEFGKKTNKKAAKEEVVPTTDMESEPVEEILFDDEMESIPNEIEEPMADLDAEEEPTVEEEAISTVEESEPVHLDIPDETEEIPEDLYAGLDGTPNTYKEQSDNEELDMDLPNIDSLKDDEDSDDDIWKF